MLELKEVHISHGRIPVVHGVTLEVHDREIVSLLGPNGAGKTTLLYAVSGLIGCRKGVILFQGQKINDLTSHKIVDLGIVQIPEGRKIFPSLTVMEHLELGSFRIAAKRNRAKNLSRVFELFPRLGERKCQLGGTLSGGEQQMLAIARGLMAQPRLLMLDEPSLGLSPKVVTLVFGQINEINKGGTSVLLVEQNVVQSLKISIRGYIMEQGKVVVSGSSAQLFGDPHTRKSYLGT
jgi:branched-chain amino acid transport system ATP-binding protein